MHIVSRTLTLTALAAACLSVGALAVAADNGSDAAAANPHAARRAQFEQAMLDKIDTNHDGVISRAEYQAWVDSRFAKLDGNGNGVVTADEIAHSPATQQRDERRAEHFVKRFDANGSGQVTKADFEARQMARFDRISGGSDTVTADQLMPKRGAFKHHRDGAAAATSPDSGQ